MTCPRCTGFMIHERSWDSEQGHAEWLQRCVICGHYDDPLIRENRNKMPLAVVGAVYDHGYEGADGK